MLRKHVTVLVMVFNLGVAASAAEPARTTTELLNGVSVAFAESRRPGLPSQGIVTPISVETLARAFVDVKACTYFGYELHVQPMAVGGRIEVAFARLSSKSEERIRDWADFARAGCVKPRLRVTHPWFPRASLYADGESRSVPVLKSPDTGRVLKEVVRVARSARPPSVPADQAQLAAELTWLQETVREKERLLFATSEEDRARFAEWLSLSDTGLTRVLPLEKYEGKLRLWAGWGQHHSFATMSPGRGIRFELAQGQFSSSFGYLTVLGDVPMESITLDHPAVRPLAATQRPEIGEEYRQLNAEGTVRNLQVAAQVDTTYGLRATSYGNPSHASEVLVVFRVVRQDTDGSVILQWKKLADFPATEPAPE